MTPTLTEHRRAMRAANATRTAHYRSPMDIATDAALRGRPGVEWTDEEIAERNAALGEILRGGDR